MFVEQDYGHVPHPDGKETHLGWLFAALFCDALWQAAASSQA